MRLVTWNMGHGSPGARRAPSEQQWSALAALGADVVLAQEARSPDLDQLGYDAVYGRYPKQGWGASLAVKRDFGKLCFRRILERPGLIASADLLLPSGQQMLLVSLHIPAAEKGRDFVRDLMTSLGDVDGPLVVGGDFNAGPSIGTHPGRFMGDYGMSELTTSDPEHNTLVRPQHPGTVFQIDHVFGRGIRRTKPMCVFPLADVGGPQLSDHNALWVEVEIEG